MLMLITGFAAGVIATALWVWFADKQFPGIISTDYTEGYASGFKDAMTEIRAKRSAAGQKAAETRKAKT